uniref:Reverse transcriptase domain-containing protein n=1 Tax=Graphocephala atropunctata TaxID=36148 RepID=A0A1B6KKS7_9HEMI
MERCASSVACVQDWNAYKRLRNQTQQQIRNAKVRFYYRSLAKQQSTKTLWAKLKDLGIGKSAQDIPIPINLNTINDHFVNIPVDLTGARDYVTELENIPCCGSEDRFSFTPVTEADVLGAIMRMTSNAVGVDKIPIRFIKDTLPITLPIITAIFNKSLMSSVFPEIWKSALVRPLPKIPSPQTPSDFRPISILPALSKCLERIVHQQFSSYLEHNHLISNFQSGFRTNHSTTTALLKITDDIRQAMDEKKATLLTLFDFSKAFDCVHHPLLFIKLKRVGFSHGCVDWVKSYLTARQQCVRTGDQNSSWRAVTRGVPQGSVLGPLLFSLYIDDVTTVISHSHFHLYADDLQIYQRFFPNDMTECVSSMISDIDAIAKWAYRHGLKLNETKTQTMVVGYSRLLTKIDFNTAPKLRLNNHELEYSDKVKNLGLIMTKHLGWTDQTVLTCNRVFAGIHSLKRFALFLPLNVKIMLVKTLILLQFNYCDIVINDTTVELSDRLQRAQNYCIKFIFNSRRSDHVTPLFQQLSLMKLKELCDYHTLVLLHSIITFKSPRYLSENFLFMSDISERYTRRGASILSIPHHRTSFFNKSFTVTACRLWNALPDNIRNLGLRSRFRAGVVGLLRDRRV